MKLKQYAVVSLVASVLALSGCSSVKPSDEAPEMMAARQCADQVYTASKNKAGKTKLTSIMKDESTFFRVGDSSQETHHIQGFPYIESTALDNGKPGSSWRACMLVKGFNIPV